MHSGVVGCARVYNNTEIFFKESFRVFFSGVNISLSRLTKILLFFF